MYKRRVPIPSADSLWLLSEDTRLVEHICTSDAGNILQIS